MCHLRCGVRHGQADQEAESDDYRRFAHDKASYIPRLRPEGDTYTKLVATVRRAARDEPMNANGGEDECGRYAADLCEPGRYLIGQAVVDRRPEPQHDAAKLFRWIALKGLLRAIGIEPPRIHDVGDVLQAERARLPPPLAEHLDRLVAASRALRRDRELAFDGAEDLTPSSFYTDADAVLARDAARDVVATVAPHVQAPASNGPPD